jgi:phage/plasmid-like protein (TIGR03299 family)
MRRIAMSHDLYIRNGRANMMYVGHPPWHGLGKRLQKPATAAEAIRAAGLDWTVSKVPLQALESGITAKVPNHFGIVPDDRWGKLNCPVFGVVGKGYQPLQNREAFEFFDSIVEQKVAMYHTAGALGQGERVWILAKLPGMLEVTPADMLEKYVLLSTGHDGRTAVRIMLTPIRVVCQNTLTAALEKGKEMARAHHTPDMNRQLKDARQQVRHLLNGFEDMEKAFRAMANYKMDEESVRTYMAEVFPYSPQGPDDEIPAWITEDRANCVQLYRYGMGNGDPGVKETLWAAYNGVTEYVDHWRTRVNSNHMFHVCLGRGQQIKSAALHIARMMVTA